VVKWFSSEIADELAAELRFATGAYSIENFSEV